jgi:hypothetical protein
VRGPGVATIDFSGATISGSHDGIEIDGNGAAAQLEVSTTNCIIQNNENGLESVDAGTLTLHVESCKFIANFNRPDFGTELSDPVAAIAQRGMTVTCDVRRSWFTNNATGIFWSGGTGSSLDMGTVSPASLGENSFCLNYGTCIFPNPSQNAYRTCLWQREGNVIHAAGNYWLAFNQGSSGTGPGSDQNGRFLTGTRTFGSPDNLTVPPGPGLQCTQIGGQQFSRNFVIDNVAGSIDFGSTLPDFDPLPPPCPICGQPCPP